MKLAVTALAIPDVKLITVSRFAHARGYFAEAYVFAAGIDCALMQDN